MLIGKTGGRFTWMHFASWLIACVIGMEIGMKPLPYVLGGAAVIAEVFTLFFFVVAGLLLISGAVITFARMRSNGFPEKLLRNTVFLSLFLTLAAAFAGLLFFGVIAPEIPEQVFVFYGKESFEAQVQESPYFLLKDFHKCSYIPLAGLLLVGAVPGIILMKKRRTKKDRIFLRWVCRLQQIAGILTKYLIFLLPVGLVAYSMLFASELQSMLKSLEMAGEYVLTILLANLLLSFVVLPCLLYCHGIRPFAVLKNMLPAVLTALFTGSSLLNVPLTLHFAENNTSNAKKRVARFVLPLCSIINRNSSAIFTVVTILVTLQFSGVSVDALMLLGIVFFSLIATVLSFGNPTGNFLFVLCFLLYADVPIAFLGMSLSLYVFIMCLEACAQVWSDSCICAIVEKKCLPANGGEQNS